MLTFNDIIREQSLVEIPIKGLSYTWSNMQQDPLLVQLNWHFTSSNCTTSYPNTVVMPLGKPVSDHIPCYVSIQSTTPKSNLFRFEEIWTKHPDFMSVVQRSWNRRCYAPNSAALLAKKIKLLRSDLTHWSKNISNLSLLIDNSNKALAELDALEDRRRLTVRTPTR